jgi:hypothetical protein
MTHGDRTAAKPRLPLRGRSSTVGLPQSGPGEAMRAGGIRVAGRLARRGGDTGAHPGAKVTSTSMSAAQSLSDHICGARHAPSARQVSLHGNRDPDGAWWGKTQPMGCAVILSQEVAG